MYQGKYRKALTFSFDDGVVFDRRLANLFNKYGMKCTFNLNSGKLSHADSWVWGETIIYHLNRTEIEEVYRGHEIASHTVTHPFLERLDYDSQMNEIQTDIENLEHYFKTKIHGVALPYGTSDENTYRVLKACNVKWNRLAGTSMSFDIPSDLLHYNGTCHFRNPKILELVKQFLEMKPEEDKVFYIWGHSYELEVYHCWDEFEELLKLLANHDDIYYCTNSEAFHVEK